MYIPLIVVNCIILGRAESYASKNGPIESIFDGIGMGLGFTMGLTIIGLIREILGAGTFFGLPFLSAIKGFTPITIHHGTGSIPCTGIPCSRNEYYP